MRDLVAPEDRDLLLEPEVEAKAPDAELPLFAPIYHAGDPATSREAAELHSESGRRETNATRVLRLVARSPGTATEIFGRQSALTLTEVRRRLTDLHHADLVRQGEKRGRELIWHVTERGVEATP
ncbi:MAG: hypothetical protein R3253_08930 [Longimicrobiales bacterium]|nr:hypothetical protein [Longimicrobiales bacterium]